MKFDWSIVKTVAELIKSYFGFRKDKLPLDEKKFDDRKEVRDVEQAIDITNLTAKHMIRAYRLKEVELLVAQKMQLLETLKVNSKERGNVEEQLKILEQEEDELEGQLVKAIPRKDIPHFQRRGQLKRYLRKQAKKNK